MGGSDGEGKSKYHDHRNDRGFCGIVSIKLCITIMDTLCVR